MGCNLSGQLAQLDLAPRSEELDFDSFFRLAHITDSHVGFEGLYDDVDSTGLSFRLRVARTAYSPTRFAKSTLEAVLGDLVACDVHHLLHTGDVGISGWKGEFQKSREVIERSFVAPLIGAHRNDGELLTAEPATCLTTVAPREEEESSPILPPFGRFVTLVPGNHDCKSPYPAYPEEFGVDSFSRVFADSYGINLPEMQRLILKQQQQQQQQERKEEEHESEGEGEEEVNDDEEDDFQFPFVKLLDPHDVVVIGLDSRNTTLRDKPHGEISQDQIDRADELLLFLLKRVAETDSDRAQRLVKIVVMHHPPVLRWQREFIERKINLNLEDRTRVQDFCVRHGIDLLLCGHTHFGNATHIGNRTLVIEGQTSNGQNLARIQMFSRPPSSIIYHFDRDMRLVRVEKRERVEGRSGGGEFWSKWYWWNGDLAQLESVPSQDVMDELLEAALMAEILEEEEGHEAGVSGGEAGSEVTVVSRMIPDQFEALAEADRGKRKEVE